MSLVPRWLWLEARDKERVERAATIVADYPAACIASFRRHAAIELVYTSNKLEATLLRGARAHDTVETLEALYDEMLLTPGSGGGAAGATGGMAAAVAVAAGVPVPAGSAAAWHPDGKHSHSGGYQAQLRQHLAALMFMERLAGQRDRPLAVADILECHGILMRGAEGVAGGTLRTVDAWAGDGHLYVDRADVPAALERAVDDYNRAVADGKPLAATTALLFYKVITVHPFVDGNGRLCRLLVAYALLRGGFPFPVLLTSGHKKPRSHHMHAIYAARRRSDIEELTALVYVSALAVLNKFTGAADAAEATTT